MAEVPDPDSFEEDPLEGFEFSDPPVRPSRDTRASDEAPLMDLDTAIEQIPAELRKEMEELLRAEFREVIRWKPGEK